MFSSGKHAQHTRRIPGIGGLAENLPVNHTTVSAPSTTSSGRSRATANAFSRASRSAHAFGGFSLLRLFRNICGLHFESNPGVTQQFLAARRGGGKYEH